MKLLLSAFADESCDGFAGQIDALKRNGLGFLEIRNLDGRNVSKLTMAQAKEIRKHATLLQKFNWSMQKRETVTQISNLLKQI